MRKLGQRERSDERILGSGEFVKRLIRESDKARKKRFSGLKGIQRVTSLIKKECKKGGISVEALEAGSRQHQVSRVRAQLAEKLVKEFGLSLTETGRYLGVSPSAVVKTLGREERDKGG